MASKVERKGAVFFIHALHDYGGRYAYLGQKFAQHGYEFFAMDQRGHGRSEGKRGYTESIKDQLAEDTMLFHDRVLEKLDGATKQTPCFMMAHSSGCLQALHIASLNQDDNSRLPYKGMSLHSPFFGYQDQEEAQRQVPLMKFITYFAPNANLPSYKPH